MTKLISRHIVIFAISSAGMFVISPTDASTGGSELSGRVTDRTLQPLAHLSVPLRNIDTGEITGRTVTDESGRFAFNGIRAGHYIVEVAGTEGGIVAASSPISVTRAIGKMPSIAVSVPSTSGSAFIRAHAPPAEWLLAGPPLANQIVRAAVAARITGASTVGQTAVSPMEPVKDDDGPKRNKKHGNGAEKDKKDRNGPN